MFNPLVSIVISAYNVEQYIEKCLQSIIAQSYRNLEIICVDDCSTDNTLNILKQFKSLDSRIKIVCHPSNLGLSESRNSGIKSASGELISFIDGDDEIKSNTFEKIIPHFNNKSVDVVWFGIEIIYEAQHQLKKSDSDYYSIKHNGLTTIDIDHLLEYDCSCCNKVFRRNQLTADFLFKGRYYEDALFFMKFFSQKRTIFFVKEKLYVYYRHPVSIMSSTWNGTEGLSINHLFILDDLYDFWNKSKLLPKNNKSFNKIFAAYFDFAYRFCLKHERAWVIAEACKRLRSWNTIPYSDPILLSLYNGDYEINLIPIEISKSTPTKKLKGWEKIFCMRNENQHKTIRLFGARVASYRCKK